MRFLLFVCISSVCVVSAFPVQQMSLVTAPPKASKLNEAARGLITNFNLKIRNAITKVHDQGKYLTREERDKATEEQITSNFINYSDSVLLRKAHILLEEIEKTDKNRAVVAGKAAEPKSGSDRQFLFRENKDDQVFEKNDNPIKELDQ